MRRPRFTVRTTLVLVATGCIVGAVSVYAWTRPYAVTGSYPNGQLAWEQWERRTLSGQIEHVRTTRWYPDGRKAFEGRNAGARNADKNLLVPEGEKIADPSQWWKEYSSYLPEQPQDPGSKRPFDCFLSWWND